MKKLLILILLISVQTFSQTMSNQEIKTLIEKGAKDLDLPFEMPGTGVILQSMTTFGRNIIFTYEVPEDWYLLESAKEELIKTLSDKEKYLYFDQQINLIYNYTRDNGLVGDKVIISYEEFDKKNDLLELGGYISYKNHPKAKGVNIKIKDPVAFEKNEGDRPNIVAKFFNKENFLSYLIQINDGANFVSSSIFEELFSSKNDIENFAKKYTSSLGIDYVSSKKTEIDNYPAIEIIYDKVLNIGDKDLPTRNVVWMIFYEDKFIYLYAAGDYQNFDTNYYTSLIITNSIVFEDQYTTTANNYVGDYQNFDKYVDQFYNQLELAGILKVRPKKVNIQLKSLDSSKETYHMHGFSTGYNNDDSIDITINKRSWNTFSKAQKYYLIFHELSHDILNLDDLKFNEPNEKNIMYPSISSWKNLTMDDFIDNFNLLLEDYLNQDSEKVISNDYEFEKELQDELSYTQDDSFKNKISNRSYSNAQQSNFIFKDGYKYDGSEWIESCVNATAMDKDLQLEYCNCMLTNMSVSLTFDEFLKLNKDLANKVTSSVSSSRVASDLLETNKLIKEITGNCAYILIDESNDSSMFYSQENIIVMAENHLLEIKNEIGLNDYNNLNNIYDLKVYSECFIKKMVKTLTTYELMNMSESDKKVLEAIQDSCFIKSER